MSSAEATRGQYCESVRAVRSYGMGSAVLRHETRRTEQGYEISSTGAGGGQYCERVGDTHTELGCEIGSTELLYGISSTEKGYGQCRTELGYELSSTELGSEIQGTEQDGVRRGEEC
eukprot:2858812-Rhodomonas_salina.2